MILNPFWRLWFWVMVATIFLSLVVVYFYKDITDLFNSIQSAEVLATIVTSIISTVLLIANIILTYITILKAQKTVIREKFYEQKLKVCSEFYSKFYAFVKTLSHSYPENLNQQTVQQLHLQLDLLDLYARENSLYMSNELFKEFLFLYKDIHTIFPRQTESLLDVNERKYKMLVSRTIQVFNIIRNEVGAQSFNEEIKNSLN